MYDKNLENEFLISKIIDKINFCKNKNSIEYTDFLDMNQKSIVLEILKREKFNNFIINDGQLEFDRNIIIMYPDKLNSDIAKKYFDQIVEFIKIENGNCSKYEHRVYLSGVMKLGIRREKFGDIIVQKDNASIIVFKELSKYIYNGLKQLKRFEKSDIDILDIEKLELKENEFEQISIIVHSLRLDNIVSELAKCSRTKAKEIIEEGRTFINNKCEYKISKNINIGDIITIRGKGKFILDKIENKTKKENIIMSVKKYK